MKTYLLSVAGVIFLSVIISLLLPEGKLHKTATFVMRIICILVLIQPLTGIFKLSDTKSTESYFDYEYVSGVYSNHQSGELEKLLNEKFETDTDCTVSVVYKDGQFSVSEVSVRINEDNFKLIEGIYEYLQELGYINITVYAQST